MGVVVRRDDGCGTMVKGNDGGVWSFDVVVLWPVGGKIEMRLNVGESDQGWDDIFIAMEVESRTVWSVVDGGGTDSMLRFWLEREDDVMKCYRKMKRM
jgi:hypothetical protein